MSQVSLKACAHVNKIDAFHAAMGRFVLEWSGMEFCLDLLILSCRSEQVAKEISCQLDAKIRLLKKNVEKNPNLAAYATRILDVSNEISKISNARHDYIHGAVIETLEGERPIAFRIGRILQPANKPRRPLAKVTANILDDATTRVRAIKDKALDLAEVINKRKAI